VNSSPVRAYTRRTERQNRVLPNPSIERDLHRLGTLRPLSIFRFACPAGSGPSCQTLGVVRTPVES
jgi:hypothetical protein